MHENANDGWHATLDGRELTPLRVDGWQQAFLVPAGAGGTVQLSYEPAVTYDLGLIGGAAGVLLLVVSALVSRTPRTPQPAPPAPPAPSWVLGVVALTAVVAMAAGPYAVIVPLLALLARFRHQLLVPLALVAMLGAGVVGGPRRGRAGRRRRGRVQRPRAGAGAAGTGGGGGDRTGRGADGATGPGVRWTGRHAGSGDGARVPPVPRAHRRHRPVPRRAGRGGPAARAGPARGRDQRADDGGRPDGAGRRSPP